jgi:hypothetical protein
VSFVRSCIGGVDFGRPVATKERCQCLIDEFGISGSSVESASVIEEGAVNGRTDPSASHATIMPRSRHLENPPANVQHPAAPNPLVIGMYAIGLALQIVPIAIGLLAQSASIAASWWLTMAISPYWLATHLAAS